MKIDGAEKVLRFTNGTTGTKFNINAGTTEITARTMMSLGASGTIDGTMNIVGANAKLIIANNAWLWAKAGTGSTNVENYGTWRQQ